VFPALPIAPLAIDDRARQWFKSSDGLAVREAVLEYLFCTRAAPGDLSKIE
jgi:hypothetical protein